MPYGGEVGPRLQGGLRLNYNMQYIACYGCSFEEARFDRAEVDPPLKRGYWRHIWVTREFAEGFEQELTRLTVGDPDSVPPIEQIWARIRFFSDGRKMVYPYDLRNLRPIGEGIWELKTLDVRLFGWFPFKDCFVIHAMADANVLHDEKNSDLWKPYVDLVSAYIRELGIPALNPILGAETQNVLSNRPQ